MPCRRSFLQFALLTQVIGLVVLTLLPLNDARAEGSWQMGLFEGLSFRQPLLETNANANRSVLRVDILNPGEVINVLACGTNNSSTVRVRMFNPAGALVYNSQRTANVDCNDDFTSTFDPASVNAHQYVTNTTGVYEIQLVNFNGTFLNRFDVTVTDSVNDIIDPQENGGRLWSDYWYFWAGSFAESASTDADLYVVADGGFTGTYFVWKLDLHNFAGFGYGLKANSLGVVSPNAAGDIVAGLSVPSSGNAINEQYPIYLSYPARDYPAPTQSFSVSPLLFLDDDDGDSAISSGGTGEFHFTTDYDSTAVYEIIIDTSSPAGGAPDGVYGQGDVFLRGTAMPGDNVVPWNGKDNNGVNVPLGAYSARVSVRTGEFHFTADDVETSGGPGSRGLKMFRASRDGVDIPTTLFWDDHTVLNSPAADAFNQIGIFDGDHNWGAFNSGGVGNVALIDTYTYGISVTPNPTPVSVVPDDRPLTTLVKSFSPSTIQLGGISRMLFEITNNGTTTMTGINVSDSMPFGMTLLTDPTAITVTGAGCSNFAFSDTTVAGGDQLNIIDGTIAGGSTCVVAADVSAVLPGNLVNATSAVTSNELPFGVGSNNASLIVEPAISGPAFACDANLYESETLGGVTRLFEVATGTLPYSRNEFNGISYSPSPDYSFTGLAYHPRDNYLYGIVTESNNGLGVPASGSVVRIDSDGKVVNLGVPQPGPNSLAMPVVSDRFSGGTFSADGNYVVVTDNSSTSYTGENIPIGERGLILEIDVSVNPPQVVYNRVHGRDAGDIVAHPNGNFYSHTVAEGLITIDPLSGVVSSVGGNVSTRLSSLMADNWGQLYGHTESTGELLAIDAATGDGTLASPLAGGPSTDGASCAYGVSVRKSVSVAEVEAGETVTYTLSLVNAATSSTTIDITDDLLDARTFVAGTLSNPLGGSVNNYAGTSQLVISGASIASGSTETLQFDVLYPAGFTAGVSNNQALVRYNGLQIQSDNPATPEIDDATPVTVEAGSGIGVSKRAVVSANEVSYWFTIENTGAGDLQNLSLADDLDTVFGVGNYRVTVPPALVADPGGVVLTNTFTGTGAGTAIIDAASGSNLRQGDRVVVRLTVEVTNLIDMGSGFAVYSNQVKVDANSPGGAVVSDISVDGDRVDPDGNGTPDEQSPTIVNLAGALTVSGKVFEDNGVAAIAHDGLAGGGEVPLSGVVVELRNSASSLIDSVTSNTDGSYSLSIPQALAGESLQLIAVPLQNFHSVSEAFVLNGAANKSDGEVTFVADLNTTTTVIDFGQVRTPQWLSDSIVENNPDTVVWHAHRYRSHSSGNLAFSYANMLSQPDNPGFSFVLYQDNNCNGVLDDGESVIPQSLSVDASSEVCVINKVYIPGNVANDDTFSTTIIATLAYSDQAGTGHGLISSLEVTDLTRAIASGEGVLVLDKTVQNLTDSGAATTRNTAAPNDVLRYQIDFRNSGTGPVTEVLIADSTPAFSVLEQPVQCPMILPDGIVNCEVAMPAPARNGAGYHGPVQWRFIGPLSAGAEGDVSFQIRIE